MTESPFPSLSTRVESIDTQIAQHQEAIRALKTTRNSLALVCQLPPEILSHIFTLTQTFDVNYRGSTKNAVTETCQYFRAVALGCPAMWANLDFRGNPDWTREMLRRSKGAPLVLKIATAFKTPSMLSVIHDALSDPSRFAELVLTGDRTDDLTAATKNLIHAAPFLRILEVSSSTDRPPFSLPDNLFNGDTPRLGRVTLRRCGISWDTSVLQGLTHLILEDLHPSTRVSYSQMMTILSKSPHLELLIIHQTLKEESTQSYHSGSRTSQPVSLTKLSQLDVVETAQSLTHLLRNLSLSPTAHLCLVVSVAHDALFDFKPFLAALDGCAEGSRFLNMQSLDLKRIGDYSMTVRAWPGPCKSEHMSPLDLSLVGSYVRTSFNMLLKNIGDSFPLNSVQTLAFSGDDIVDTDTGFGVFEACTQLTSLTLKSSTHQAIAALGAPPGSSSNNSSVAKKGKKGKKDRAVPVVFPLLRDLSISGGDFGGSGVGGLQKMLEFRSKNKARIHTLSLDDCTSLFEDDVDSLEGFAEEVDWDHGEYDPDEDYDDEDDYSDSGNEYLYYDY